MVKYQELKKSVFVRFKEFKEEPASMVILDYQGQSLTVFLDGFDVWLKTPIPTLYTLVGKIKQKSGRKKTKEVQ